MWRRKMSSSRSVCAPAASSWLTPRQGRIIEDEELKREYVEAQPYGQWLKSNLMPLENLPNPKNIPGTDPDTLLQRQQAFG